MARARRFADQAGIEAEHIEYDQTGDHGDRHDPALSRYCRRTNASLATGPIAILPLQTGRCGMVWTRRPAEAARLAALSDEEFLREFQAGLRLPARALPARRRTQDI
jgi:2-octaprenyl-6-methoxyphenol hydroxylase